MKTLLEFINTKRLRDDVVVIFDGRSRECRKVIDENETMITKQHTMSELWLVYEVPTKDQDPRVPTREQGLSRCNAEMAYVSLPLKSRHSFVKVMARSDFNNCGETMTSSTTCTGIPMRRMCELPRMTYDVKAACVGAGAAGAAKSPAVAKNVEQRGHVFSYNEVKPVALFERIFEHLGATHVVDFTPGSGACAVAAAGAGIRYDGIAANQDHAAWLDVILDRIVFHLCSESKQARDSLEFEDEASENVKKYFGGLVMEGKRYMEPGEEEGDAASETGEED